VDFFAEDQIVADYTFEKSGAKAGDEIPVPGVARVTVNADDVLLGEPFGTVNRFLLQSLQRDLTLSGIPTRLVSKDDIWAAIWGKVIYNCALNPFRCHSGSSLWKAGRK